LVEYVKSVRRHGKLYLYLTEVTEVGGKRQQRVIRSLTEEEAKRYGWKPDGENQTAELQLQAPQPASAQASVAPEEPVMEPPQQENDGDGGGEGAYAVIQRGENSYALEPSKPNLRRGYVIVTDEGRVFCGLCPGFTCSHVKFMHGWLRTHQGESE